MKKIYILLAFIAILFSSCENNKVKSREDIIKDNLKNYLSDKLNDPDSYEFVSLNLIDSIKYIDNINYRLKHFDSSLKFYKNQVELGDKESIKEVNRNNWIIYKIDSIKNSLGNRVNDVAVYKYIYKFRANNQMGGKSLNEYILLTKGSDNSIIQMENNPDKIYINPTDFPGYMELIEVYKKWE
ncbi:MAG: hypothetical protein SPG27_09105 [Butyricimonas virosa]|nr:hypothetical protein [Butyricimonas virosa]